MRIVIVDDEYVIRQEMCEAIEEISSAYEIVGVAENGQEGLDIIRSSRPDLVITDIHMPMMDGFTMLSFVRAEHIDCKVIVLSNHADFALARRAMALGVWDYLCKIDVGDNTVEEFAPILSGIQEEIRKEQTREKILDLEHLLLNILTGVLEMDKSLEKYLKESYGISEDSPMVLYKVTMKENYETYGNMACRMLKDVASHQKAAKSYVLTVSGIKTILMVSYDVQDLDDFYERFRGTVTPMLSNEIKGQLICSYGECAGFSEAKKTMLQMMVDEEWKLLLGRGHMISQRELKHMDLGTMRYPYYLGTDIKNAIMSGDRGLYIKGLRKYRYYCVENRYSPGDIKEVMIRCFFNVMRLATVSGQVEELPSIRHWIRQIEQALGWSEIRNSFLAFFDYIQGPEEKQEEYSSLVKTALAMIKEYFNQGISLGEIAKELNVTEAYLSTQLKKETGKYFTEIVKNYRIPLAKKLLISTSMKLTDIAKQVGYSDAKYMSKVFKEEVGMLPAEYRKKNNLPR